VAVQDDRQVAGALLRGHGRRRGSRAPGRARSPPA
jgi:hypothetical protein